MATGKVKLTANDGTIFELELEVAFQSELIKQMCSNLGESDEIDLDVEVADGMTLQKIIEYCADEDLHYKRRREEERVQLSQRHINYLNVDGELLVNILTTANFLIIPGLLDITSQYMADLSKGKTVAEIRAIYQLPDDLTSEEKEEVHKKYEWLDV